MEYIKVYCVFAKNIREIFLCDFPDIFIKVKRKISLESILEITDSVG